MSWDASELGGVRLCEVCVTIEQAGGHTSIINPSLLPICRPRLLHPFPVLIGGESQYINQQFWLGWLAPYLGTSRRGS